MLFLAGLIILEFLADLMAKQYQLHRGYTYFTLALLGYLLANTSWLIALRSGINISKGGMIFAISCAVMAVLVGILYKEHISKQQYIGFAFGIISLILILWEDN